jgi:hypothetical protein
MFGITELRFKNWLKIFMKETRTILPFNKFCLCPYPLS